MSQLLLRPRENAIFEFNSGSYANVDEEVADDGATYIYLSTYGSYKKALFRLVLPDSFISGISSVVVHIRAVGGSETLIKPAIRTYGTYYYGTEVASTASWADYSYTWSVNPYTGVAWTTSEIVDLWAGLAGHKQWSGSPNLSVTQIYVEVNYSASGALANASLRPRGAGDVTELAASSGSNYQCVDEASANEDTDYVLADTDYVYEKDTYALETVAVGQVAYVVVYATVKKVTQPGEVDIVLRTGSTNYVSINRISAPASYTEYYEVWGNNPNTLLPWTQADIDALQAGVQLHAGYGVAYSPRCTQVYAKVYFKPKVTCGAQIIGL